MSTGKITTIEGILDDLSERMDIILRDEDITEHERETARNTIESIRNVTIIPFTLVLEDESGKSRIQSSRTAIETIDTGLV